MVTKHLEPLVRCVSRRASAHPDKPAVVCGEVSISYAQLWLASCRGSAWLERRHVSAGDRVLLTAHATDPWFAAAYLATHLAGAIAVPLDAKAAAGTIASVVRQTEPVLALAGELLGEFRATAAGSGDFAMPGGREPDPDTPADILFTTGSTGEPKGVLLTHRNITAAARNMIEFVGNAGTDREVVTVPLSHSFGLGRLRANLIAGGTLILVPGLSFPALVFRALEVHRATGLACVPAGVAVLLRQGDRLGDFADQLGYMELGSAPMEAPQRRELMRLLSHTRICMHYGLTEASRSAFIEFHAGRQHLDSIGRPAPNVSIRVRDEARNPVPAGTTGHIQVSGETVMSGYWRDAERTAAVLGEDGWLDTGDLGHFDGDGYLYLDGRGDDLINVGGRKVFPAAVELAAAQFPAVAESACIALPDPQRILGEVPVLYVVPADSGSVDGAALIRFLAGRIEAHAVPVAVHLVTELPKTGSGKLLRSVLRARASG